MESIINKNPRLGGIWVPEYCKEMFYIVDKTSYDEIAIQMLENLKPKLDAQESIVSV